MSNLRILQKFTGFVESTSTGSFWARLTTIIGEGSLALAEIWTDVVRPGDSDLIRPGNYFTWTIYSDGRSIVEFSRPKAWTQEDMEEAMKRGRELMGVFE